VAGAGGYLWENSDADWRWTLGVNLLGVANGIRHFVPRMIAAGLEADSGHVVNSASIAGWLCAPLLGVYNASKAAVVAASETLYHDLRLAGSGIGVSVLCPAFVPTAIFDSERNRPADLANTAAPTASQRMARAAAEKAVAGGRLGADEIAAQTFEAIRANRFYVFTHPQIMPAVRARFDAALAGAEPADPFAARPGTRPARPG
jgi:NAD(P)-dependent dehydrogenase (short-subunit alcohol dehydrogenase family)